MPFHRLVPGTNVTGISLRWAVNRVTPRGSYDVRSISGLDKSETALCKVCESTAKVDDY